MIAPANDINRPSVVLARSVGLVGADDDIGDPVARNVSRANPDAESVVRFVADEVGASDQRVRGAKVEDF